MLPLMPEYVGRRAEPWRTKRGRGTRAAWREWIDRMALVRIHRNSHIKPKAANSVSFKRWWRKNQGHPLLAEKHPRREKRKEARKMWREATRTRAKHGRMLGLIDYSGA